MSNNIFSGKRFQLLFKQHFLHNAQLLFLSTVAYIGVMFIILSVVQVGNNLAPHGLSEFQGFLVGFITVFGILYVGHSFPAFRSKESTISYLMIPASLMEKFVFEFVSRIGLSLIMLPLLFWIVFNLQGYFFTIFTERSFEPVGIQYLFILDDVPPGYHFIIYSLVASGVFFVLSLAFTGSAMFDKQPLVKTLFAVAIVVMSFVGYSYIVVVYLGVGLYNPTDEMMLFPLTEDSMMKALAVAFTVGTIVMLVVAFRKLKEREV